MGKLWVDRRLRIGRRLLRCFRLAFWSGFLTGFRSEASAAPQQKVGERFGLGEGFLVYCTGIIRCS